jgi:predicted Zn-dependent protease
MGRRQDARLRYESLLADHPQTPRAAYRLAVLYAEHGERLDRALELASVAKQMLPDDPAVSDALGWVLVTRNLPETAIPQLTDSERALAGPADGMCRPGLRLGAGSTDSCAPSPVFSLQPARSRPICGLQCAS